MPVPDSKVLAPQLRCPSGAMGRDVATMMVQYNGPANALAIEQLKIQPTDSVLEIGFGPGEALAEAAMLTPKGFVAGLDHSKEMLSMASERNKRAVVQDRIELQLGSASAIPYRDAFFDAVFCVNVAHFWAEPMVELREIFRVLKPGGRFVFVLPSPETWLPGIKETGIFFARTPEEYRSLLTKAGFSHIHVIERNQEDEHVFCVIAEK